jgi:hypothetical protein
MGLQTLFGKPSGQRIYISNFYGSGRTCLYAKNEERVTDKDIETTEKRLEKISVIFRFRFHDESLIIGE